MTSGYMAPLFIFIERMPFMGPTLDNDNSHFALRLKPSFYLHHVEVVDQDPTSAQLYKHNCSTSMFNQDLTPCFSTNNPTSKPQGLGGLVLNYHFPFVV